MHRTINNLRCANDTTLLAGSAIELENMIERIRVECEKLTFFKYKQDINSNKQY